VYAIAMNSGGTMKLQVIKKELIQKHEDLMESIEASETVTGPLLDEFEKLTPTNVYFEGECLNISLTGDKHKLLAAIRILRRHGYKADKAPEDKSPNYYAFFHKEDSMIVWFSFSSTKCRRIKVGTKTVEQDIYETVCDEQEFPQAVAS
jgi:hypothetical protein